MPKPHSRTQCTHTYAHLNVGDSELLPDDEPFPPIVPLEDVGEVLEMRPRVALVYVGGVDMLGQVLALGRVGELPLW